MGVCATLAAAVFVSAACGAVGGAGGGTAGVAGGLTVAGVDVVDATVPLVLDVDGVSFDALVADVPKYCCRNGMRSRNA